MENSNNIKTYYDINSFATARLFHHAIERAVAPKICTVLVALTVFIEKKIDKNKISMLHFQRKIFDVQ